MISQGVRVLGNTVAVTKVAVQKHASSTIALSAPNIFRWVLAAVFLVFVGCLIILAEKYRARSMR
jgi:hypothetical protein